MLSTNHALKEWAIAVAALEQGETIMLLRKGGIHEQGGRFQVAHDQILLYPTYEHQQPSLLKPEYANQVTPVPSGWHAETIQISAYAQITEIFQVSKQQIVSALLPFHIWNEQFVSDRLKWKPRQPLYVLLLRTYKLASAQVIPYRQEYGGCKSWIELLQPISLEGAYPILDDAVYSQRVAEISNLISTGGTLPTGIGRSF